VVELLLEEGANVDEEWVTIDEAGNVCLRSTALSHAVRKGLTKPLIYCLIMELPLHLKPRYVQLRKMVD